MSYHKALEAAGAEILHYESFGSYQGDWWAKVRYNGEVGWVNGSYGSCSGCDAFEAEFGFESEDECEEHKYDKHYPDCAKCVQHKEEYTKRLKSFGENYLTPLYRQEEAEKKASENLEWDSDAPGMLKYIQDHK